MPLPDAVLRTAQPSRVRDSFTIVNGVEILVADWREATPAELRVSMGAISNLLRQRLGKSLLLFEVVGMRWDAKVPFEGVAWMREIAPRIGRVAIAGASGLQLTVLTGMRSLSGMPLPVFPTREEAIAWLSRPRRQK